MNPIIECLHFIGCFLVDKIIVTENRMITKNTKNMIKLSIIIPIYNVDKYISQCLESCIYQEGVSHDKYEIIVVNDGTLDNSMEIVNKYKEQFPLLITVFEQKNSGLSVARNSGINLAKGEYIWFVDSDDWITQGSVRQIIDKLNEFQNVDLLQIQAKQFDGVHADKNYIYDYREVTLDGPDCIREGGLPCPAQVTICNTSYLKQNNLYFMPGIYHEDAEFKPRAVYMAKSITYLDKFCYVFRREGQESITSKYRLKNGLGHIAVIKSLNEFSKNLPTDIKCKFNFKEGMTMNSLLCGIHTLKKNEQEELIGLLKENSYVFHNMRNSGSLKYWIEGILLSLNIRIAIWIHRIIRQ